MFKLSYQATPSVTDRPVILDAPLAFPLGEASKALGVSEAALRKAIVDGVVLQFEIENVKLVPATEVARIKSEHVSNMPVPHPADDGRASIYVEPLTVNYAEAKRVTGLPQDVLRKLGQDGTLDMITVAGRKLFGFGSVKRLIAYAEARACKERAGPRNEDAESKPVSGFKFPSAAA